MPVWIAGLMLLGGPADAPVRSTATALSLFRGAPLQGQPVRYWDVTDTVLESGKADGNFGGESYLSGGPGRVILIRFGDLRRALGPSKRITKARLVLAITGGTASPLSRASEVLVPWGEGPTLVVGYGSTPPSVTAPAWSATWKHRRSGEGAIAWQQPGASGVGDVSALPEPKSSNPDPDHVQIEGLENAIQRQYERPYDYHGLALTFPTAIEFASSQARTGRPVLELEFESAPKASGPDLAVLRISRTPEYPRYSPAAQPLKVTQDGVEVELPSPPANSKEKLWPSNGEEVTYTAVVKNVGDAVSGGFLARWSVREKQGSAVESDRGLAPGEEATLTFKTSFRNLHTDHRLQPLSLEVEPKGPDAESFNNALGIEEGALALGAKISPDAARAIAEAQPLGESTPDGFAQALVRLWNGTLFPQSRFSFAPDGALERFRLQTVKLDSGELDDRTLDVSVSLESANDLKDLRKLLRQMGRQLGLPDLSVTSFPSDSKKVVLGSSVLERGSLDLFPGLMGGGDTRNEGHLPAMLILPHEPASNPVFDVLPIESTDLLSATEVAALNSALGHRRGFVPEALYGMPTTVLLRVLDQAGLPVKNASVEVFQMANGAIRTAQPVATVQTGTTGTAILPSRPTQAPEGTKSPLGQEMKSNPFGALDPNGANGLLLLKINAAGNTDFAFLKAWQIADAYRRNPTPALVYDVRVNVGGDVDRTQNLAKNKIVTDSGNQLPAKLAALVDDDPKTLVEFGGGKDGWIEIDLGRDRVFGEVTLVSNGPFWEQFAITAYATGQTSAEAKAMVREASWTWTFRNRSSDEPGGGRSVAYRTSGIRARFLRIARTGDGPPGSLSEIRVHPLRAP